MKPTDKPIGTTPSDETQRSRTTDQPAAHRRRSRRASSSTNGGSAAGERSPYAESLVETCASIPRLQSFSAAIGAAGLSDLLRGDDYITIFAPTDKAINQMPGDAWTALLGDKSRLAELIRHHVVPGRVKAPRRTKPRSVTPHFGDSLTLTASAGAFHVDKARIVKTNIRASNGVIHAIDTVLVPD